MRASGLHGLCKSGCERWRKLIQVRLWWWCALLLGFATVKLAVVDDFQGLGEEVRPNPAGRLVDEGRVDQQLELINGLMVLLQLHE
jgi:hypothetical protein